MKKQISKTKLHKKCRLSIIGDIAKKRQRSLLKSVKIIKNEEMRQLEGSKSVRSNLNRLKLVLGE